MTIDYDMIPRATYCQPQIGSFGYSEAQAKEKGYDVKTAKFPFSANGKAHGLGDATGFVKLVADAKYGEILGVHMIGPDVTELLPELTLAQQWDLTAEEVARNVHAHPTLSEALEGSGPRHLRPHDQLLIGLAARASALEPAAFVGARRGKDALVSLLLSAAARGFATLAACGRLWLLGRISHHQLGW